MASVRCMVFKVCNVIRYKEKEMGIKAPPTFNAIIVLPLENCIGFNKERGVIKLSGNSWYEESILNIRKLIKLPVNVQLNNNIAELGESPNLAKTMPKTPIWITMIRRTDKNARYKRGIS